MGIQNSVFHARNTNSNEASANGKPKRNFKMWCNVGKVLPNGSFASMGGFGFDAESIRNMPTDGKSDFAAIIAGGNQALRASLAKLEEIGPGNAVVYTGKGMPFAVELRYAADKADESEVENDAIGDFVL